MVRQAKGHRPTFVFGETRRDCGFAGPEWRRKIYRYEIDNRLSLSFGRKYFCLRNGYATLAAENQTKGRLPARAKSPLCGYVREGISWLHGKIARREKFKTAHRGNDFPVRTYGGTTQTHRRSFERLSATGGVGASSVAQSRSAHFGRTHVGA